MIKLFPVKKKQRGLRRKFRNMRAIEAGRRQRLDEHMTGLEMKFVRDHISGYTWPRRHIPYQIERLLAKP